MSPTHAERSAFDRDYNALTPEQRRRFLTAVAAMVADMKAGRAYRPGLRIKRVQGRQGVWEMSWAPDGRATFEYGPEVHPGEPLVIWRRAGTHDVFRQP